MLRFLSIIAVCCAAFIYSSACLSDEETPATKETPVTEPDQPEIGSETETPEGALSDDDLVDDFEVSETFVDDTQRVLSEYIVGLSNAIDSFFGGDRNLESSKGSYGCITYDYSIIERGEYDHKLSACLKLVLPNTKDRFNLIISGASDEEASDRESLEPGTETSDSLELNDSSVSAALRYVSEASLLKDVSTDIGIKGGTPLDPFVRVRYRKTRVPNIWLYRFTESLYYYRSIHGGLLTRLDFERPFFDKKLHTRLTSEADFRDEDNQFHLKQVFSLYRKLDKKRAIEYELIYFGFTRPNTYLDRYLARIRVRELVHKNWLYLELRPQVDFERDNDFSAVASFTISLEALFGKLKN